MKIPWLNKITKNKEKVDKEFRKENQTLFKFNQKSYTEESLSNEVKELIKQLKRYDEIINHQKNKIQLLKNAEKIVIDDLRKNISRKD
tara:strand:+ start:1581 stop:1844 length:264 start_codon:yes stop_codon:yes gene_type:complete